LRFEDGLNDLTDDAPSSLGTGDEMSSGLDLGNGISGTCRQACGSKDRQVRQIVADVTDLTFRKAKLTNQRPEWNDLVIVTLENVRDTKFTGPALDSRRTSTRKNRSLLSGPMPQAEGQAVANMEVLCLDSSIVEHNGTVGQHAVDIGNQKLDRLASRNQIGRRYCAHDRSLLEFAGDQADQVGNVDQSD
jgi:hypothetical protein